MKPHVLLSREEQLKSRSLNSGEKQLEHTYWIASPWNTGHFEMSTKQESTWSDSHAHGRSVVPVATQITSNIKHITRTYIHYLPRISIKYTFKHFYEATHVKSSESLNIIYVYVRLLISFFLASEVWTSRSLVTVFHIFFIWSMPSIINLNIIKSSVPSNRANFSDSAISDRKSLRTTDKLS